MDTDLLTIGDSEYLAKIGKPTGGDTFSIENSELTSESIQYSEEEMKVDLDASQIEEPLKLKLSFFKILEKVKLFVTNAKVSK